MQGRYTAIARQVARKRQQTAEQDTQQQVERLHATAYSIRQYADEVVTLGVTPAWEYLIAAGRSGLSGWRRRGDDALLALGLAVELFADGLKHPGAQRHPATGRGNACLRIPLLVVPADFNNHTHPLLVF